MVWSAGEPTNATKIRNNPGLMQANWVAIEDSDSSFQPDAIILTDRNPLVVADDAPAAVSGGTSKGNGYTLYSKQDTPGKASLFGIDLDGTISQFTHSGSTMLQEGYAVIAPGAFLQWGRANYVANSAGTAVVFPTPFNANAWVVNSSIYGKSVTGTTPHPMGADSATITDLGFTFSAFTNPVALNFEFGWIAIGPIK